MKIDRKEAHDTFTVQPI